MKSIKRRRKEIFAPGLGELVQFRDAVVAYMQDDDRPGPSPSMLLLDAIDIVMLTELRISEVLGLRWDYDVHLGGDMPRVVINGAIKEKGGPKVWEGLPKTEAGIRVIALAEPAVEVIQRRARQRDGLADEQGFEYVFRTRNGRPNGPQDVHRMLRNVRLHAGLPDKYVPHSLRRSVGTEVADDLNLEEAAMLLSHARSRVTEHSYAKRGHGTPDVRNLLTTRHNLVTGKRAEDTIPAATLGGSNREDAIREHLAQAIALLQQTDAAPGKVDIGALTQLLSGTDSESS